MPTVRELFVATSRAFIKCILFWNNGMSFIVLDVETDNANLASVCQIGIAIFAEDGSVEQWESLVGIPYRK